MTEEDAVEVVRRLKAGTDVGTIVKNVRDGNLLMQLSLTPETTRQFELPYLAKMPSHLFVEGNPYMNSRLFRAVSSSTSHTNAENRQLTAEFLAEARRLWDLEPVEEPYITTIQAALALSQTYIINGLDKLSTFFLEQAIKMGQHMHLFDSSSNGKMKDTRMAKAGIHTAWKTFSWQAMLAYSYLRAPLLKDPPQIPLPDMELDPQWYGETWVQYPHDQNLTALCLGHHMKAEAELFTIFNELSYLCFGRPSRSLITSEILSLKGKFDAWKAALPGTLQPGALVLPHSFSLHFRYHQAMIGLMQLPLADSSDAVVDSGIGAEETPKAIIRSLEVKLEFLMRLYYMRHSFVNHSPWLIYPMARLGNHANELLEGGSDEDPGKLDGYRSTIILCAKALESQAHNFHVATSLGIQLHSIVKPEMLQLLQTYVKAVDVESAEEEMVAHHPHSQWPIPIINLGDDPEKARVDRLIEGFKGTHLQSGAVKV
ncbi:hypothetical protein N0V91_004693 [Didymella pomorum]|uniref:Transcription factor domain-containing protein n=1 Tax=Didymella pomorum TaxID=749634 RepID=A0A9W8ZFB9_9PLEO|nr:hypothetical protein N0V91_004693 [Didymella pomorum]